jgi:hypothetical protein
MATANADDVLLEDYLNNHTEEVINWVNDRLIRQFRPTGEIYDRLVNQVVHDYPYGPTADNAHRFLTTAIMGALWCGWFSQARSEENDPNFNPEHIERYRTIITNAFEIGKRYGEAHH